MAKDVMLKIIKVIVDGIDVYVKEGMNVYQACIEGGKALPRFCYHEDLMVAGNCRICMVELEGYPKPIPGCAILVKEDMKIMTDSPMAKKAREGVMEIRLMNHPLDCPICDQGGECDLQDQALIYGTGKTRIWDEKRGVVDKDFGILITSVMTRCIHCTRCLRYLDEVGGEEVGMRGRGNMSEIGIYEGGVRKENMMMGNREEICPVGARLSKEGRFSKRKWEYKDILSNDGMDDIRKEVQRKVRGTKIIGVKPVEKYGWISDKTRYSVDGLDQYRRSMIYTEGGEEIGYEEGLVKREKRRQEGKKKVFIRGSHVDLYRKIIRKRLEDTGLVKVYGLEGKAQSRYTEGMSMYKQDEYMNGPKRYLGCDIEKENPMMKLEMKAEDEVYTLGSNWNRLEKAGGKEVGMSISDFVDILNINHDISSLVNKIYVGKKILMMEGSGFIDILMKLVYEKGGLSKEVNLIYSQDTSVREELKEEDLMGGDYEYIRYGVSEMDFKEAGKYGRLAFIKDKIKVMMVETGNALVQTEGSLSRLVPRKMELESTHLKLNMKGELLMTGIKDKYIDTGFVEEIRSDGEGDLDRGDLGMVSSLDYLWDGLGGEYRSSYALEGHPMSRGSKVMLNLFKKEINEGNFEVC